jgi:glutamate synthase (NADPH/NADH) large chain
MESTVRLDHNHQLTVRDFPYIVKWRDDRCKRCGRCTSVCPMLAIEPSIVLQREVRSEGVIPEPKLSRKIVNIIRQVTDIERYCNGCGTCTLVCPNEAIEPEYNPQHKFIFHKNAGGYPYRRGGRRNDPEPSTLDHLKFTRISMLTDPALDAGRHEFRIRTYLGRILPPGELPIKIENGKLEINRLTKRFMPPCSGDLPCHDW